jgi:U3 small nucleolar RNA-associated protein 14
MRHEGVVEEMNCGANYLSQNVKYLASSLPHPFETRAQYERSLRLPVGPEWTTKETFQDATKPRILLKQGIIAPMSKPLV